MSNPPKQKGTGGETELRKKLNELGVMGLLRTSPSVNHDLVRVGDDPALQLLATRPDRGQWLVTMNLEDFVYLLKGSDLGLIPSQYPRLEIEVKRHKKFAHHSIFESKFK